MSRDITVTHAKIGFADGVRALAIGIIVIHHVALVTSPTLIIHHVNFARATDYFGVLGVAALFTLSGYLLSGPFLKTLVREGTPLPSTWAFYQRRFLRIVPLYAAIVLALSLLLDAAHHGSVGIADVTSHLFFLHDFSEKTAESISPVLWTMSTDIEFYLALPAISLLILVAMRSTRSTQRVRVLILLLVCGALFSVAYRAVVIALVPGVLDTFRAQIVYLKQLPGMAAAFSFGALIALGEITRTKWPERRVGIACMLLAVTLVALHALSRIGGAEHTLLAKVLVGSTYDLVPAIAAALFLYAVSIDGVPAIRALLSTRLFAILAALSYAVYLVHYTVISYVANWLHAVGGGDLAFSAVLAVALAIILPIAAMGHLYVERPFLNLKARIR